MLHCPSFHWWPTEGSGLQLLTCQMMNTKENPLDQISYLDPCQLQILSTSVCEEAKQLALPAWVMPQGICKGR